MHRDDIDGLRTLAVLPVIAFHFAIFPQLSGGGFVGVDIFFVISGYLITHTIYRDINNKTYTIADFYNRRMRRIFPALFTIFIFCIAVTFFSSFPSEAKTISVSIISSIFFVSNLVFYSQSGYFDQNSATNPLLHMWSLSVEEQFYVIFPLIIYLIRNFNNKDRIRLLCGVTFASFLWSIWMVQTDTEAAFYLVQFRGWELLIGSLLAIKAIPKLVHQWQAESLGIAGIALIIISVIFISKDTPFPGLAALAPCIGALAVIHSGAATTTITGRILAFLPIRFIGLISYSLYLWHWPVIVFYRLFVSEPSRIEKGALVAFSVLAAAISWRYIERPFREKPYKLKAHGTLLAGGAGMILTAIAALALSPLIEKVYKYPSQAMEVLSYAKIDEAYMRAGKCFLISSNYETLHDYETLYQNDCLKIKPKSPNFLILGDSHAAQLWLGLQTSYPAINFLQATVAGCQPTIEEESASAVCTGMMKYIIEIFLPHVHLDGVIISGRWKSDEIVQEVIKTANEMRSYVDRVIIFGPIVEYDEALPRILARAIASKRSEVKFADLHRMVGPEKIDQAFSVALERGPIEYVSIYRTLCTPACEVWATKGVPLQFDNQHLTREGSITLARKIGTQLFPNIPPISAHSDGCGEPLPVSGLIQPRASDVVDCSQSLGHQAGPFPARLE
jgi:peptidoglycan/LPS O-acetylase OafA/YrhL